MKGTEGSYALRMAVAVAGPTPESAHAALTAARSRPASSSAYAFRVASATASSSSASMRAWCPGRNLPFVYFHFASLRRWGGVSGEGGEGGARRTAHRLQARTWTAHPAACTAVCGRARRAGGRAAPIGPARAGPASGGRREAREGRVEGEGRGAREARGENEAASAHPHQRSDVQCMGGPCRPCGARREVRAAWRRATRTREARAACPRPQHVHARAKPTCAQLTFFRRLSVSSTCAYTLQASCHAEGSTRL
jgi:hypothetical protein